MLVLFLMLSFHLRSSVFPDMTKEVAYKRKRKLHTLNVRFTLAFPAVLHFTWKGESVSFTDPREAMKLLNEAGEQSREDVAG